MAALVFVYTIYIYVHAQSLSCVQLFVTLWTICSTPGSSVYGIFQTGIEEWVVISYSRGSSWPTDQICISRISRQIFYYCTTWEATVQFSCSVVSDSLQPHGLKHARPPCPSPTPSISSNSCPLSWWCHQPSHLLPSLSCPAFNLSQYQGLFHWVSSSHQVAKVLEFQLQHQSFQLIFRTDFL